MKLNCRADSATRPFAVRACTCADESGRGGGAAQGCALVVFHAHDVLAEGLYERLGYDTVGVVESWPAGSATRWFRKAL